MAIHDIDNEEKRHADWDAKRAELYFGTSVEACDARRSDAKSTIALIMVWTVFVFVFLATLGFVIWLNS